MAKETDYRDSVCTCIHWFEEHGEETLPGVVVMPYPDATVYARACGSPGCDCGDFEASKEFNTPEAIADRGGEHDQPCNCNLCRFEHGLPLREF